MDMIKTPAASIDATEFGSFIEEEKSGLKDVEVDMRDAKRRITAAKGGSKKKKVQQANSSASSDDDVAQK